MVRMNSGVGNQVQGGFSSLWAAVEELVTGEPAEPTSSALRFLEMDHVAAVQALCGNAHEKQYLPYEEMPKSEWPADILNLKPVAVLYFQSRKHPDGEGIIIVVERHRGWDAGILICVHRSPEWQGPHLNGQIMSAGPDFGFRRMEKNGHFWHWYPMSRVQSQTGGPAAGPPRESDIHSEK
ncbi:MAG: hypothetical protein LR011_12905 [Verrucomicrobia bacterium]|nr:hypothetical protein [Verrucomicrobiota bacterium]